MRHRRTHALPSVLLALAAALVALASPLAAARADAAERVLVAREGKGFLESIDGQLVCHLEGAPREMGLQHGRLLGAQAKENVRAYLRDFALKDRGHTVEELLGLWRKHLPHVPAAIVEELEGLAEGAGIPRDELLAAHVIPTMYHCSGAALSGPATRDGKLYHYRSLDYALTLGHDKTIQENAALFVRRPATGVAHMVVGWAGVVGAVTGMNAEGVSLGEMGSKSDDEERAAGTPMVFHMLSVLTEARSGEDAVRRFREWKRGEGYNFIVGCGKTGKAWAIEVTRSKIAVFGMGDPAENVAPHSAIDHCVRRVNHFVSPELAATQRKAYDPRAAGGGAAASFLGYELITSAVKERFGRFDAEGMIGLCRGYPPEHPCLHQAVMCPTDGRFWVSNAVSPRGNRLAGAQNQRFHAYDLKELLGTDPATLAKAPAGEKAAGSGPAGGAGASGGDGAGAAASSAASGRLTGTRLDLAAVPDEAVRAHLAAFDPPSDASLAFEWKQSEVRAAAVGGAIYDVTFPTPLPSGVEENDTVYCRYYAPRGLARGARAPAAVVLHHLGGSFELEAALADYLAKAGIHALEVEFPYYGPRRPKDRESFQKGLIGADFPAGVKATRQAVADVRRAADWLLARGDVDADRMGVVGISLGGICGSIVAGVDPRFQRNVFAIAGGDIPSLLLNESRETRKVREILKERGIGRAEIERELLAIEPTRFAFRIPRGGTLMLNAKRDEVIPKACTEKLWEAAGRPEIIWYESGHATIAVYLAEVFARTRNHFERAPAPPAVEAGSPAESRPVPSGVF